MRIAHLLRKYDPTQWGGTETAVLQLVRELRALGTGSVAYCPKIAASAARDPLAEVGCELRRYKAILPVWGISEEQRRQQVAVGGNMLSFDLPLRLWNEPGISVVHSHVLGRIGGIGLTIARRRRVPFVVTIHGGVYDLPETVRLEMTARATRGIEWGKPFGMLMRARRLLDEADAVVTCNPREAELVQQRHPAALVKVQRHGVDARAFLTDHRDAALSRFPELHGRPVLLCLGRIDAVKNQAWLVEQAPALRARHPNLLVVLAGPCTDLAYGEALKRRIVELGLGGHVLLTGEIAPEQPALIGLLQLARLTVLQSVSETFGLVILEAWAAGTPAMASRTSGPSALIADGENGLLFDLDQPAGFHRGVDAVLGDPTVAARLAGAGRAECIARYDSNKLAQEMQSLYARLAEEPHAHRHLARR